MAVSPVPLDAQAFSRYAHPLQRSRFALALVFALLLFPLIAVGLVFGTLVLIVPIGAFVIWLGIRIFFANYLGNAILVSQFNYPRINSIAEGLKAQMGYDKRIHIFVYEQGNFNAGLRKFLFGRQAIFLNSEILENGVSDDEVRWIVGRFVGYLRARQLAGVGGWLIRAAEKLFVFNIFLLPYDRALVYTGDRLALAAIDGDISSAASAMQKLLVGRQLGYSLNPEGIIEQQREVRGSIFAWLARLPSPFPFTTTRYVDLIVFARAFFPERFATFAAANPELPADLPALAATPLSAVAPAGEARVLSST